MQEDIIIKYFQQCLFTFKLKEKFSLERNTVCYSPLYLHLINLLQHFLDFLPESDLMPFRMLGCHILSSLREDCDRCRLSSLDLRGNRGMDVFPYPYPAIHKDG